MAAKQQSLPHYGVKNGFTRKGKVVYESAAKETINGGIVPATLREFPSITQAKRYMRTGK